MLTAPIMPWWIIFFAGAALVFSKTASIELIGVGMFLDFFLLDTESGFFGLFYTLYFFILVTTFIIFKNVDSNRNA